MLLLTVLMFGIPALYLLFRGKKQVVRDTFGAVLVGGIFGYMLEYVSALNGGFWTYHFEHFVFRQLLPGGVPLETMLWAFIWALYFILVYEHFFDAGGPRGVSRRYLPILIVSLIGIFNLVYFPLSTELFTAPYAYVWWGLGSLIPVAAALWLYPRAAPGLLAAGAVLVLANIVFEWASLREGYWHFGGEYIYAYVFGSGPTAIPFEELAFWVLVTPTVVLANFILFVRARD